MPYQKHRFGQNFLQDEGVLARIAEAVPQSPYLWEIGPGKGALTAHLQPKTPNLSVFEIDFHWTAYLQSHFPSVEVVRADATRFDFSTYFKAEREKTSTHSDSPLHESKSHELAVVGSLPYNVGPKIMFHLLESHLPFSKMVFMLELAVVEKICASQNDSAYGRISASTGLFADAKLLFKVPPHAFHPEPSIFSGVFSLTRKSIPQGICPLCYTHLVSLAFRHKRKMIGGNLKGVLSQKTLEALGVSPTLRAENLSVEDFMRLVHAYPCPH